MIGKVLGHYRVLEKIGSGGMGEVYRASDERLGRDVALKMLKPSLAHDQDRLRRFEQEARAAAALSHPNIVAIYDIGMYDGSPYIVSELLEGQTLRERLLTGPIPQRQAIDYAGQIAQGLVAAHEKRIVHRDLKPENLFITKHSRIKILDFGIAKLINSEFGSEASSEAASIASMTTQTRTGSVLGTVAYMSPEQLRGKAVDHRSDIFSFGAILYEMRIGKRAFAGETQVDTMTAILKEDPAEMIREGQDIPVAFEQVVRHCLEKEPENRFQSARDLAFALSTLSDATTGQQVFPLRLRAPQVRIWLPRFGAALLLAAVAIFLGYRLRLVHNRLLGSLYSGRTHGRLRGLVEWAPAANLLHDSRLDALPTAGLNLRLPSGSFAQQRTCAYAPREAGFPPRIRRRSAGAISHGWWHSPRNSPGCGLGRLEPGWRTCGRAPPEWTRQP
jgi:hypothetical protein